MFVCIFIVNFIIIVILLLQELRGSVNISKAVISPTTACPKLAHLDLYGCPKLAHVLIQSQSLLTLNLTNCTHLTKVKHESGSALMQTTTPYAFMNMRKGCSCVTVVMHKSLGC